MTARMIVCAALAIVLAFSLASCLPREHTANGAKNWRENVVGSLSFHDHRHLETTVGTDGVAYVSLDELPPILCALEGGDVTECVVRYGEDLPLGEHVQTLVSFIYDEDGFASALESLGASGAWKYEDGKITPDGVTFEELGEELFPVSAFITVLSAEEGACEYVLADGEALTLRYVYLRFADLDEVAFDKSYLPAGYAERAYPASLDIDVYRSE